MRLDFLYVRVRIHMGLIIIIIIILLLSEVTDYSEGDVFLSWSLEARANILWHHLG